MDFHLGRNMKRGKLTVGLLSHLFACNNLGCAALSVGSVLLLDRAAARCGIPLEYRVLVSEKQPRPGLDFTQTPYSYGVFPSGKQGLLHPLRLLNTAAFAGCDAVFPLCGGDGFSDIYGLGRLLAESYMPLLAAAKGVKVALAPQAVGPFSGPVAWQTAKAVLGRCHRIFTRDYPSARLCAALGFGEKTFLAADLAFVLPYHKREHPGRRPAVGVNVSGLLYADDGRAFGLALPYRQFTRVLVELLLQRGWAVHLISHVNPSAINPDQDAFACAQVARLCPGAVLAPRFSAPAQAKGYIAGLDFFVGARMHATIAAFSSGVPVVPVAYSPKFSGLYRSLGYPYLLDARRESSARAACRKILGWMENPAPLKSALERGNLIAEKRLEAYCGELARLLEELAS